MEAQDFFFLLACAMEIATEVRNSYLCINGPFEILFQFLTWFVAAAPIILDSDCQPGLKCMQRGAFEKVPGWYVFSCFLILAFSRFTIFFTKNQYVYSTVVAMEQRVEITVLIHPWPKHHQSHQLLPQLHQNKVHRDWVIQTTDSWCVYIGQSTISGKRRSRRLGGAWSAQSVMNIHWGMDRIMDAWCLEPPAHPVNQDIWFGFGGARTQAESLNGILWTIQDLGIKFEQLVPISVCIQWTSDTLRFRNATTREVSNCLCRLRTWKNLS